VKNFFTILIVSFVALNILIQLLFMKIRVLLLSVFILVVSSMAALAQTSTIRGILLDGLNSKPLPNVIVSLKGSSYQGTTNGDGEYEIKNVPYGSYIFEHSATGFNQEDGNNAVIVVASPITTIPSKSLAHSPIDSDEQASIPTVSIEQIDASESSGDNISGVLGASRDPFFAATTFTFSNARFRPRGYNNENLTLLNGIPMEDQINSRGLFGTWGGLNDIVRSRENSFGLNASNYTYGSLDGSASIDAKASRQRRQFQVSYAKSNRTYDNRLMATLGTGLMKGGWSFSSSISRRWADESYVKGTYYDGWSWYMSLEKRFSTNHSLSLTQVGANTENGSIGPAVQEIYDLVGDNYYNPNWGYQNGKVRNANVASRQEPLTVLTHEWKLSDRSELETSVGYQYGLNSRTALDWFNSPDPRADFYRRLPSFIEDPIKRAEAEELWRTDEAYRQINWDALYNTNTNPSSFATIENVGGIAGNTVSGQRSAYIVTDRTIENQRFVINIVNNTTVNDHLVLTTGFNHSSQESEYYLRVNDLLGGDFYVDINQFAEQDYPENEDALQNNLLNPNNVVRVGDKYGYDYKANINKNAAWIQTQFKFNKVDFFLATNLSSTNFYRTGEFQNGIFSTNSYGKSSENKFINYSFKGGLTYKLDGRNYFFVNGLTETRAPLFENTYISPRTRDTKINNVQNEEIYSFEGGYVLRAPKVKIRATAYFTQINNGSRVVNFYHEDFRTFVNYAFTNIDRRHTGIEIGADITLGQGWTATGALALGQHYYTSRMLGNVTKDNSAETLTEDEVIYSKNFYVAGGPQTALTAGLSYRSKKFWSVYLNANYYDRIYYDFNPARRTSEGVAPLNDDSQQWDQIIDQKKAPGQFTLDAFGSKSWKLNSYIKTLKNPTFLVINAGLTNILNNQDLVVNGFEQLRFDFAEKNPEKFAARQVYGFGTTFFASVTLRFN